MTRTIMLAAAGALLATGASAAPLLNQGNSIAQPNLTENVRLVCDEYGRCYRARGPRYVERRYYGDSYAYGRRGYAEPGYGRGYYGGGPSIGLSFGGGRY